ncbi:MAG TPA: type IV pilus assembly protein PilM [Armatimonadota bacterium]
MAVTNKGGTPVLGLDIGAAFIKVVEMRPSKGALSITGVGVLPTPPGCIVNDEIVDPAVLASAIKQLLAESRIKTKSVVASVAGQSSVVVRVIEVPKMTDKELAETMKWEIDRHIPFAPDEVVKDFEPMARPTDDPNSPNMAVLLAVAQNAVVAGMLQTILMAGLTPVAIDVECLAGARALFDVDDAYPGQTVALVNIGASKIDVGIYESGTLAFPRTIPVAGNAMTEAVSHALNVDITQAEHLKKQHGFVPDDASERWGGEAPQAEEQFEFGDFAGQGLNLSAPLTPSAAGIVPPSAPDIPIFGDTPQTIPEPTFGTAPAFGDPEIPPAFGVDFSPAPADGPTFELPDVGPANSGPVEPVVEAAPAPAPEPVPEVLTEAERHRREISDAFMPVVAEMATEIKRSVEYYTTRANDARVDRVVLFGGVTNLPGLNGFLEKELGLPVQIAGLPAATSLGSPAVPSDYLQQIAALIPVAIGLSARNAIATAPVGKKKAA